MPLPSFATPSTTSFVRMNQAIHGQIPFRTLLDEFHPYEHLLGKLGTGIGRSLNYPPAVQFMSHRQAHGKEQGQIHAIGWRFTAECDLVDVGAPGGLV
jgi:hypothetical protein